MIRAFRRTWNEWGNEMTMGVARQVTLFWMLATTAHVPVPVPVWDGEPSACAGAIQAVAESPFVRLCELIDFVRLGCRTSNELEHYPYDDDPSERNGTLGMFPVYLAARESDADRASAGRPLTIGVGSEGTDAVPVIVDSTSRAWLRRLAPDREARFGGRQLQVMRC